MTNVSATFLSNCYKQELNQNPNPNFLKSDYNTIRERLRNVNWELVLQGNFCDFYAAFIQKLKETMTGCIPNRKAAKTKKSIYLTNEALRKKDFENKLWRRYKKNHHTIMRSTKELKTVFVP